VKNNLQTVAALLRLQARRLDSPDARAALEESVRRVSTIALVHETLSLALEESVLFDGIADRVLAMCAEVALPETDVAVVRRGDFGVLPAEVATPLAMILTELVQNAVEHAGATVIEARVSRTPEQLRLVVADDGRGLPPGFSLASSTRLGLQIVRTLVEGELRGSIDLAPGDPSGTAATLSVPLTPASS
jgi:two-component sensor histidine kinase